MPKAMVVFIGNGAIVKCVLCGVETFIKTAKYMGGCSRRCSCGAAISNPYRTDTLHVFSLSREP